MSATAGAVASAATRDGRIGPAHDQVFRSHGLPRPSDGERWIELLDAVSDDIQTFEAHTGRLFIDCVPARFTHLRIGRLYDMALGPRQSIRQSRLGPHHQGRSA